MKRVKVVLIYKFVDLVEVEDDCVDFSDAIDNAQCDWSDSIRVGEAIYSESGELIEGDVDLKNL